MQDDVDHLLRDSVNAVARALGDDDSFAPFMLVIDRHGRKTMRMSPDRADTADERLLTAVLEVPGDRRALRARATVFDVTVSAPFVGTAVKVAVEHSGGVAIDILVPYTVTADEVRIDLDSAAAAVGARKLWN